MFETENGTFADIESPAVNDAKHDGPYPSNFVVSVTIDRDAETLYKFWSNPENLPRFMENVKSVTSLGNGLSHWVVQGPAGDVEFDSRITEDTPGQRLAWSTEEGADVESAGWVQFRAGPEGRGTEVRARISFKAPMGALGRMVAAMKERDPHMQARRDLRRFKQLMETGEVSTALGSSPTAEPPAS